MKPHVRLATLCLPAMVIFMNFPVHAADRAPSFDIVGLRLGMTVEETKKALLAYDPAMTINEHRLHYIYGDGVNNGLRSKDFISYIDGTRKVVEGNQWGDEGFTLHFTPMPDDQRVVGIIRRQSHLPNPPTGQQYRDSLTKKYGPPVKSESGGLLRWEFPAGKVNCLVGSYMPGGTASILRYVFQGEVPGRFHKREIKDLSQCTSYLEYQVGLAAQPASTVTATMLDVEGFARGELRAREWVAGLKEEARKAREAKGKGPRL